MENVIRDAEHLTIQLSPNWGDKVRMAILYAK